MAILVIVCVLAISFGDQPLSLHDSIAVPGSSSHKILVYFRLPRVALALVAGAGLSAAGVAFQAILRNPLAEPYLLGVSGGAALGATLALVFGLGGIAVVGALLVPASAMAGGLIATAFVYALATTRRSLDATSLILSGVVVNILASAVITFLKILVSPGKSREILGWLMGFVGSEDTTLVAVCTANVAFGVGVLLRDAGRLHLMVLGADAARALGQDTSALVKRTFVACSIIVGAVVSLTGLIGFVGLVVPHALRRVVGPDVRRLLPLSLPVGGAVLVACDWLSRILLRWLGTEPPVGAVTALLGGPLFLWLMFRSGRSPQ